MFFTYYNFIFSVSSSFIVISACSSLITSFLKSISGSRIEDGCDVLSFLSLFFRNCGVRVIIKNSVILCFYSHAY